MTDQQPGVHPDMNDLQAKMSGAEGLSGLFIIADLVKGYRAQLADTISDATVVDSLTMDFHRAVLEIMKTQMVHNHSRELLQLHTMSEVTISKQRSLELRPEPTAATAAAAPAMTPQEAMAMIRELGAENIAGIIKMSQRK
jgi:hypothetical protein